MPVYNARAYLHEAFDSVIRQTFENWELIVCDDASTDGSRAIIDDYVKKDARILVSHNETNQQLLKTRNRLLSLCRGDFITFQDADDISDKCRLEKQLKEFTGRPKLGICGTNGLAIDSKGNTTANLNKPGSDALIKSELQKRNAFIGSSIMVRREVYEKIGGFRPFFDHMSYQDYDWAYLISDNFEASNVQEPLYLYRQHNASNSKMMKLERLLASQYVRFLGDQRRENKGEDALMNASLRPALDRFIESIKKPYFQDPSRLYREYAALFMYGGLTQRATKAAGMAIKANPALLENYKTYLYCLRTLLFQK